MIYRKMDSEKRSTLFNEIKIDLLKNKNIVFVYLFGSFKNYDKAIGFKDIDIAIYFAKSKDALSDALSIGTELSYKYDLIFDCIPLNDAPLYLKYRIFHDGIELFCKDKDVRDDEIEETVNRALDFMPLRDESIRNLV